MELAASLKSLFVETAKTLKGSAKRLFRARTVPQLGPGGQRQAPRELGWNQETIRKGTPELRTGITGWDAFGLRGCKPADLHLPDPLEDIQPIGDAQSPTDPQLGNRRLYTRLTAREVGHQLRVEKGYTDEPLPLAETIGEKRNQLGYHPKKLKKSLPKTRAHRPRPSSST